MSFKIRVLSLLSTMLALTGCSSTDALDLFVPSTGYKVHKNIAYGDNAMQKLDIYEPENPDAAKTVIVFFYGGSWQNGSKDDYRFVGQALTSKGYTVVIPNYRLYPEVYYPT